MKKIFLALLLCFFLACPSYAQSVDLPSLAQSQFLNAYTSQGLTGCSSSSTHDLVFADGTSQANIDAVTTAAAAYDWTGSSIKVPDVIGFFTAIANDTNLPAGARTTLPLAEGLMIQQINNPTIMNSYISNMVTSGAYPWLSLPAIEEIVSLAQTYNIPIQAPSLPTGQPNLTGFKLTMLQDNTIPVVSKIHLLTYASTITDLIGYANATNPTVTISASVSAGTNVVLPVSTIDASDAPNVFAIVTDGTNKDICAITAVNNVAPGTTITVSGLTHNYASGSTIQVCTLLSNAWLAIATTDNQVSGVTCTDGVSLVNKVYSIGLANYIDMNK